MEKNKWPELSFENAKDTYTTIHMWTQIIGKIKLALNPWINHSWHTTLRITTHGMATGLMATADKHIEIRLNFLAHQLEIISSENDKKSFDLKDLNVSKCYKYVLEYLNEIGIPLEIHPIPSEIADAIPFDENHDGTYEIEVAIALHRALLEIHSVFLQYRSEFIGKSSDVQFFWGSFDLSVSRFSGRQAPLHPGGIPNFPDWVAQEAYSHEVMNCGFWPGSDAFPHAAFYSYIYPAPDGFAKAPVAPKDAFYHADLGEFILKYEVVQKAANPSEVLLEFLHNSYDHAAELAGWDEEKFQLELNKD